MGLPNSPTTLSARGRRTRTILTSSLEPKEDEEAKKDPDIFKTPARTTRGQKSSIKEKKIDGAAASSLRRSTRISANLVIKSASRSSCYRTRLSSRRKIANPEERVKGNGNLQEKSLS